MHRLAYLHIQNFRACKNVELPLADFTPLVGQNNSGKSTILESLRWLLKPESLSASDSTDPSQPVIVSAKVEGIDATILSLIPDARHRTAIAPYCPSGVLWIRARTEGKKSIQEVGDPATLDALGRPQTWKAYPTGLPQAVSVILPEPLSIQAMKDVQKDFTSVAAGTTIKRLIEELAEPITQANAVELNNALKTINDLLTDSSGTRSKVLDSFDSGASKALADFFPGLSLRLSLPETKLKELFKSGSLRVAEHGRSGLVDFSQVGSGAQRSIEIALLCYLANSATTTPVGFARKLLLIDEPELYLHPQAVRRVRESLRVLAGKGFQIIFSTHSPMMIDRGCAANSVIVKKPSGANTETRTPLESAVRQAFTDAQSQSRALFELGNMAEIYFSDLVVMCEGKTDRRLLPLAYERIYGRSPENDHIAFVSIGGCSDIRKALAVLAAMKIKACAVADLDFAFVESTKGSSPLIAPNGIEVRDAKSILSRLQPSHGFALGSNGLPVNQSASTAANTWGLLAADSVGNALAATVHSELLKNQIWIWKVGTIEHVTGTHQKGEAAIMACEADFVARSGAQISQSMPELGAFFGWLKSF